MIALILLLISSWFFVPIVKEYLKTGLVPQFPTLMMCGFCAITAVLSLFAGMILQTIIQKHKQEFEFRLQIACEMYRKKLRDDENPINALMSVLPAGTLSGAPKVRAMEIIDELENKKRGVYGGTVGYLGFDGNIDTCIAIRTVVFKDGKGYVQAGAGIVNDSVPEKEFMETKNKALAVVNAVKEAARL